VNVSDGSDETLHGAFARPTNEIAEPDPTTQLPAPPSSRTPQLALIVIAVAAASFLLGIGVAALTHPAKSDGELLASREVGPSGGTIRFDGGQVRVPEGAVSQPVTIAVRRSTVDERVRVGIDDRDSKAFSPGTLVEYAFEPSDVSFGEPVELTFRLPAGARNGTVFARRGASVVLLTGTVDVDRATANIRVRDFRFEGPG
jgi:hypothetical protein